MMKKILDFLQKNFTGGLAIPILNRFLILPKLAPLFTLAITLAFFGDTTDTPIISLVGYLLILLSVFCFFLLRIFPNRQYNGLTK